MGGNDLIKTQPNATPKMINLAQPERRPSPVILLGKIDGLEGQTDGVCGGGRVWGGRGLISAHLKYDAETRPTPLGKIGGLERRADGGGWGLISGHLRKDAENDQADTAKLPADPLDISRISMG